MARYDDPDDTDDIVRKPNLQQDLTPVDWVICILCAPAGCIVGIVRMVQGNPTGGKMIAISLIVWAIGAALNFAVRVQR